MKLPVILALAALTAAPAFAQEQEQQQPQQRTILISCPSRDVLEQKAKATQGVRFVELTPEQWQFLRGVYVMNPNTPSGLPLGDRAYLMTKEGQPGGLISFGDATNVCIPMMPVPQELIDLSLEIATGVPHPIPDKAKDTKAAGKGA
jgi:hypothetical protein